MSKQTSLVCISLHALRIFRCRKNISTTKYWQLKRRVDKINIQCTKVKSISVLTALDKDFPDKMRVILYGGVHKFHKNFKTPWDNQYTSVLNFSTSLLMLNAYVNLSNNKVIYIHIHIDQHVPTTQLTISSNRKIIYIYVPRLIGIFHM